MNLNKKSFSVIVSLLTATTAFGLAGCSGQSFGVVKTVPPAPVSKTTDDPSYHGSPAPEQPTVGTTNPDGTNNPNNGTGDSGNGPNGSNNPNGNNNPGSVAGNPGNTPGGTTPGKGTTTPGSVTNPGVATNPPRVKPTPSTGVDLNTTVSTESFSASTKQTKKIDFLFVIDNSPSMSDNQKKLAQGFQSFANTFFRRSDLDICTMIITSDRYLGKADAKSGYLRERPLPCTKPAGSENWTAQQMQDHINSLISEFERDAAVGTRGSPTELLGKSLVSFLQGAEKWGETPVAANQSAFFRKDAVANISFLTDENNYFFDGPTVDETMNDLPYMSNIAIPGAKNGEKDKREGIKEYLDAYFTSVNPNRALNYSTTSILQLRSAANIIPGISVNLNQLASAVGRESKQVDITGSMQSYTDAYQSIADAIVLRATTFTLSHAVQAGELNVRLVRKDGSGVTLSVNKDYTLQTSTVLTLNPSVIPLLQGDDQIDITYRHLIE